MSAAVRTIREDAIYGILEGALIADDFSFELLFLIVQNSDRPSLFDLHAQANAVSDLLFGPKLVMGSRVATIRTVARHLRASQACAELNLKVAFTGFLGARSASEAVRIGFDVHCYRAAKPPKVIHRASSVHLTHIPMRDTAQNRYIELTSMGTNILPIETHLPPLMI